MNENDSRTARRIVAIKAALSDQILNAHEIADRIGLCFPRTEDYLQMMVESGDIHIKRWSPPLTGKQQRIQHYALGRGRNAPKPPPYTEAERMALTRARIRKDDERYDKMLSRDRVQKHLRRIREQPATWLSALGAP